jgi:hypothetical protein
MIDAGKHLYIVNLACLSTVLMTSPTVHLQYYVRNNAAPITQPQGYRVQATMTVKPGMSHH